MTNNEAFVEAQKRSGLQNMDAAQKMGVSVAAVKSWRKPHGQDGRRAMPRTKLELFLMMTGQSRLNSLPDADRVYVLNILRDDT